MTSESQDSKARRKKTTDKPPKSPKGKAPAQAGPTIDDATERRFPGDNAQTQGLKALRYEGEAASPSGDKKKKKSKKPTRRD